MFGCLFPALVGYAGEEPRMGCFGGCLSLFGMLLLGFLVMLGLGMLAAMFL